MMSRFFISSVLVLLVCSAFAEEASHQHDQTKGNGVEVENAGVGDMKQGGGGYYCGRYGCCKYGRYGRCQKCCRNAEEATAFANEAETMKNTDKSDEIEGYGGGKGQGGGQDHGGGGGGGCGRYGCCKYGNYGGCQKCCHNAEEAKVFAEKMMTTDKNEIEGYGGGGGGGGGCGRYGCGGQGHGGGGCGRFGCGGQGHGGGGCGRFGCCKYGYYGGCQMCCHNAVEAKVFANEAEKVMNTDKSETESYGGGKGQGGGQDHGGGGGGGGCGRYGCCKYGHYGGCQKCCHNAEEAKNSNENQAKQETKN